MEELEPTYEDIYAKIRERRIILGHQLVFNPNNVLKKSFNSDKRYLIN